MLRITCVIQESSLDELREVPTLDIEHMETIMDDTQGPDSDDDKD